MSRSPRAPRAGDTIHVAVLGIDGSGKSTIVDALPQLLAAEFGVVAGGAGDDFRVAGPDQDYLAPGFSPDGIPLSARLARLFRRVAKRWVDHRKIYPVPKLLQMLFQDAAARRIGRKYRAMAVVCDGNTLLSAVGRGANYRRPASAARAGSGGKEGTPPTEALREAIAFLVEGRPLSPAGRASLPSLGAARALVRIARLFGFDPLRLPDVVLFLDLSPEESLARIRSRGRKIDRHENLPDLAQAREMYLRALDAFAATRGEAAVARIAVTGRSAAEACGAAVAALAPRLTAAIEEASLRGPSPLGTSKDLSPRSFLGKVLNHRYLLYLVGNAFRDAWREPAFILSASGRKFLREGYSGGVMRVIYDQGAAPRGFAERIFMGYPLHRAVYDRLGILSRHLETEISARLAPGRATRIFTAPSGHAYDLFLPLESIARREPELVRGVTIVAADLDPHGELETALLARAAALGVALTFFRGDLAGEALRRRFAENGPYDLALFVGLSSWLPKPDALGHLRLLRSLLAPSGLLVTDSFTPAPYALSGRYAGYKAHYYTPRNYALLLEAAGFDGLGAHVESGRDGINHVFVARPKEARGS